MINDRPMAEPKERLLDAAENIEELTVILNDIQMILEDEEGDAIEKILEKLDKSITALETASEALGSATRLLKK